MAKVKGETSFHEDLSREDEVKGSSNRSFGIVFCVVFLLIGAWPLLFGRGPRLWSLAIGGAFLLVALVAPKLLAPLNRLWFRFGLILHHIVSPIVLGLMFFLTITPIGLFMRLLGKDFLRLRREPDKRSYWIEREPPGPAPETMINQF